MRVSEQFIANLLARIDLVELISKRIVLKQVSSNFIGLCPFHHEKTPSFTVNRSKQFFYCFGCKAGGDAIKFIMLIEHKGFLESVEFLANQYGLALIKETAIQSDPIIVNIYKILNLAADFYHNELFKQNLQAETALNYLQNRGLNLATIKNFKLGLASSNWTNLLTFCEESSLKNLLNVTEQTIQVKAILQQAGLIIQKNNKFYDRFRSRIMFPIINKSGKVIAFGARLFNLENINNSTNPKYLNSPETIVFSKQKELYGLYQLTTTLKVIKSLLIVEGYLDVLTLFQSGISNVVATLGTALNEEHIKNIIKITPEIIFCFDGDIAGSKASIRAMELAINMLGALILPSDIIIKFVTLPEGFDPDLMIRKKGIKEFEKLVAEAKVLSDFFFEYLLKKYPENNIESLNKLAQEAKTYINKLPKNLLSDLWYEKLANMLGITTELLKPKIKSEKLASQKTNYRSNNKGNFLIKNSQPISNAIKAIAMLLLDNKLLSYCNKLLLFNNDFIYKDFKFKLSLDFDLELFLEVLKIFNSLTLEQHFDANNLITKEKLAKFLEPAYAQKIMYLQPEQIIRFIPIQFREQEFIEIVKSINRLVIGDIIDNLLMISKERALEEKEKMLLQQLLQDHSYKD